MQQPYVWGKCSFSIWPKVLSTNQIAAFFDHQCLWKKSVDIFDLLHGDNHQKKVRSETNPFGWVWPVVHLV